MAKRIVTQEELRRKLAELQEHKQIVEANSLRKYVHAGRKVNMPKRKLRIVRETPPLGICEYCNMQFSAVTPLGAPNKISVQEQFKAHKCKRQDFAQNARRIVKEATEKP